MVAMLAEIFCHPFLGTAALFVFFFASMVQIGVDKKVCDFLFHHYFQFHRIVNIETLRVLWPILILFDPHSSISDIRRGNTFAATKRCKGS
jgi:hypothetical protein